MRCPILILAAGAALVASRPAHAQQERGLPALHRSLGQPPRWHPYAAGGLATGRSGGTLGYMTGGIRRPITNPVSGLLAADAEGYARAGRGAIEGGSRLVASVPALGLSAGVDWSLSDSRVDAILGFRTAVRRGGLLGHGTMLRLDWLPTRDRTVGLGIQLPLVPHAGRTRPRQTQILLPRGEPVRAMAPLSRDVAQMLDSAAQMAPRVAAYVDAQPAMERAIISYATGYTAVARRYHDAVIAAFARASGDQRRGATIAAAARHSALTELVLPYDAGFGQVRSGSLDGLFTNAQDRFARWVRDSAGLSPSVQPSVLATNARWLAIVSSVHREIERHTEDARFRWIPLQLALTPEEHDEQEEVDSIIARAVGRPFTDGNALTYLKSSDLPLEIARSIYAARRYHVLWMHDVAGTRESGAMDDISYDMVADAYLPALTAAVRRYDTDGELPAYFVFIDQFFYEPRAGRLWMNILQDPLGARIRLPGRDPAKEAHLLARQIALRAAVSASRRLQSEAAMRDRGWLRRVVKVHVNVTNPSDFSFRSHRTIPPLPMTPDNIVRDHRKVVFYDLDEADPYRGALLLMGVGIGEHYASATWEDRGMRVRGPAALEAREALRRLLRAHGMKEQDLPGPFRSVPATAPGDAHDYVGRAIQVHNEVGFGAKDASVTRALLYTLAPPGSIIIAPDPLWLSDEWAGMLVGAAARGARVHVVAPALENAPSPQAPLMALMHDVLLRMLQSESRLRDRIAAAGGALRIGLFAATARVDDVAGRRREVSQGLARAPWIREIFPFDAAALAAVDRALNQTTADGADAGDVAKDERPRPPQLHQKTQLVARPGAIGALLRQPGWDQVLAGAMQAQSRQSARFAEQLRWTTPAVDESATRANDAMLRGYERTIPEPERKRMSFYFGVSTQNHDPRGMVLDGEATLIVSGLPAAAGLADLYYVMARSTWVSGQAELERLLPRGSALMHLLARLVRPAL